MVHTNTLPFESAVEETRPTAKGALHMRRIRLAAAELPGHGCVFFELCARLPAFKIERIASSDRGSSVNWRTARLVRMSSETVMLEYLPLGCKQRSKRKPIPL